MIPPAIRADAERTLAVLRAAGRMCATAESCTGGLIAAALTAVAGSSDVVDRGYVTYSNAAKAEMIGVPDAMLAEHGAVSAPVAAAMARGALTRSRAQIAVAVTGIAGPGGGSAAKPVGLVFLAVATAQDVRTVERRYGPLSRDEIRERTVIDALALLREGP
jgi:nicotinamide-nucleotide amidase